MVSVICTEQRYNESYVPKCVAGDGNIRGISGEYELRKGAIIITFIDKTKTIPFSYHVVYSKRISKLVNKNGVYYVNIHQ